VSPIVLITVGIDLILGIYWMKQNQAVIQCKEKAVALMTPMGDRINVEVIVQKQQTATVNQLNDGANKEDPVVEEFLDVFPDELLGMPPDRDLNLLLKYYLEPHP
jgi:hypothetical protein